MKYVVIGICIVAVAVIVALLIYRKKKTSSPKCENKSDLDSGEMILKQTSAISQPDQNLDELVMVFCDSAVMGLWEKSKNSANDFLSY